MIKQPDELVVLVDEQDRETGTALKSEVHHANTPLHRAFSVFVFNDKGEVLVQQRAKSKKTWGGVWSNTCCGHPGPGESYEAALRRRVQEELGISLNKVQKVSDYRYRFERDGVVENEVCPIYIARSNDEVKSNPEEVEEWRWMEWETLLRNLREDAENVWSEWVKEEAEIVDDRLS